MAVDVESIGVGFDTTGLSKGTAAFEANEAAAIKAAAGADLVSERSKELARQTAQMGQALQIAKTHTESLTGAKVTYTKTELDAADAADKFMFKLQQEVSQVGKTRMELLQLQAAQHGVADAADPMIKKLAEANGWLNQTGMSARAQAAAMRGVPAQFTDIFTSIQGGQAPMTVLLQQGGQLKDMFGGIGPAARAMGGYVMGMVTPLTIAGAALGGLGYLYYKGHEESVKFNKTLALTGDYAGVTAGQFDLMADRMASATNKGIRGTKEALMELMETGRFTGTVLEALGKTVMTHAELSGKKIDEIAKDYAKMPDGVAKWAEEHNKSMHFMSLAQYEHIRLLEEQGKKQEAMLAVSKALDAQLATGKTNLGYLESAWRGLGNAASWAWDKMLNVGRTATLEDKLNDAATRVENARKRLDAVNRSGMGGGGSGAQNELNAALAAQGVLQSDAIESKRATAAKAENARVQEAGIAAANFNRNALAQYDKQYAMKQKLAEQQRKFDEQAAAGAAMSQADQDKIMKGIRESFDSKSKVVDKDKELLASTKAGVEALRAEADASTKLTPVQREYAALMARIHEGKVKYKDSTLSQVKAMYDEKLALESQVSARDAAAKATEAAQKERQRDLDTLTKQTASLQEQIGKQQDHNATIGKSKEEIAEVAAARAVDNANMLEAQAIKQFDRDLDIQMYEATMAKVQAMRMLAAEQARGGKLQTQQDKAVKSDAAGDKAFKDIEKALDPTKAQSFGDALKGAFEGAHNPMAKFIGVMDDIILKQTKFAKLQEEAKDIEKAAGEAFDRGDIIKGIDLQTKATTAQAKIEKAKNESQLDYYGDIIGSMKGFFKENSDGYKALQVVQAAFAVAQAASNLAMGTSAAAVGVATQAQGDPYTAWARMAAMAATMASLGFAIGGFAGGGGDGPPVETTAAWQQGRQGTGSVLGDESAKSESIVNSLEILQDNSSIELSHSQNMLTALRSIRDNISGMAAFVAQTSGLRGSIADGKALGVGSTKGALGFSSSSTELVDTGILLGRIATGQLSPEVRGRVFKGGMSDSSDGEWDENGLISAAQMTTRSQTVGDVLSNGIQAQKYSNLHKEKSSWWGLSKSSSDEQILGDLPQRLKDQMSLTIGSLYEGVIEAAKTFGVQRNTLTQALSALSLEDAGLNRISLMGLSGDDLEKELQAVFGQVGDRMAEIAMPGLKEFQKVGEGYMQTLVRVANGIDVADYALDKLNIRMIDYTNVANKQGDVAAELFRDSVLAAETMGGALSNIGNIVSTLDGSVDELADTYKTLIDLRALFNANGLKGGNVTTATIRGAGGVDNLTSGASTFFENFFSEAEQQATRVRLLNAEFQALGLTMPQTREAFRAMVTAADDGTESGNRLVGKLLSLAGAADAAATGVEKVRKSALDTAYGVLERAVAREKSELERQYQLNLKNAQQRVTDISASVQKLSAFTSALSGTISRFRTDDTLGMGQNAASAQIKTALAIAKAGGVLPDLDKLQDALSVVSQPSEDLYASFADYAMAFDAQAQDLMDLNSIAGNQLDAQKRALALAEQTVQSIQDGYKAETERLDSLLEQARAQIDAVNGVNQTVMTVTAAVQALNSALRSYGGAGTVGAGGAATSGGGGGESATNPGPNGYITHNSDGSATLYFPGGGSHQVQGPNAYETLAQTYPTATRGYANGGYVGGTMVGETGTEYVDFAQPGRVYTNEQTRGMFDTTAADRVVAVLVRVEAILKDVKTNTGETATSTKQTDQNVQAVVTGNATFKTTEQAA